MNDSARLAKQLDMALHGGAWHGPSWKEILEGMTSAMAANRPIAQAHSIVDIVRHSTTWNDVVRLRLEGELPNVPNEENWPETVTPEKDWDAILARFFDRGVALRETIAAFPPERLLEKRPSPADGTWEDLILGQLQHVLYHAGQAAILKKAAEHE